MLASLRQSLTRRRHSELPWERIESALRASTDKPSTTLSVRRLAAWRSTGKVFLLEDSNAQRFLLKRSPHAQLEAQALTRIHSAIDAAEGGVSSRLRGTVPRLLAHFEDHKCILTEFFPNTTDLSTALRRAQLQRTPEQLDEQAQKLGRWLADFQRLWGFDERARLLEPFELEQRLFELERAEYSVALRARRMLKMLELEWGLQTVTMAHGDFAPRNVLLHRNGIRVIDWEMVPSRSVPVHFDLHHFLLTVDKAGQRGPLQGPLRRFAQQLGQSYRAQAQPGLLDDAAWAMGRTSALIMLMSRQYRALRRERLSSVLSARRGYLRRLGEELDAALDAV
ncbi:MAG: phosphotransferase [Myxococcota bacterium]|jgi:hypothetical protein|nr:phosphotransferase [Myxococcota bacterium]